MRRLTLAGLCFAALLALAPTARTQAPGLLTEFLEHDEDAVAAAYLWIDAFHDVGEVVAGLEQAAGLPADEMTITLESYYDHPLPAGDELARRGLVRVARYGVAAAGRLRDTARLTGRLAPAEVQERLTSLLIAQIADLEGVLNRSADLATEALVCTGHVPAAGAPTACGDPVDPAVWMQLRDQINILSSEVEREVGGSDDDE